MTPGIPADGAVTISVEEKFDLARWSADGSAVLFGVLIAIALYAVVWMYRREGRGNMTQRIRVALVGCRVLVIALLAVIAFEPVMVEYLQRRLDAYTLVLIDDSASMSLEDRYRVPEDADRIASLIDLGSEGAERSRVCERILSKGEAKWLETLADRNHVKVFSFSNAPQLRTMLARRRLEGGDKGATSRPAAIRLEAAGSATDVGLAVRTAVDSVAGAPVAGVVLLSDGGFNRGESPSVTADFLRSKQIPLYAVGVGDPADPVNLRVARVSAPRSAFKNDPFTVSVMVEAEGITNQDVKVELLERKGEARDATLVETRTIKADADGRLPAVVFERKVADPGEVAFTARAVPLSFEAVTSDNQREGMPAVRILDDRMKVLLIAGAPSYDYRFLARLLERDETVELSTWLQSADVKAVRDGNDVITELPAQFEEINRYDALILIDADPKELDPTWGSQVATYVSDYGGGLLVAAGNKFTSRFLRSPKLKSLVALLPIVPDPEAEIVINELGHYQMRGWPILVPDDAAANPILRQSDNVTDTQPIWSFLAKAYWHYPVRREKPVATALMRHSNPRMANSFGQHVLMATQFVGTGRTAFLSLNSTWRWRRSNERHFDRFWIQTLRYLVEGKLLGGRARGQIMTAREQYELGDSVVVQARALDEQFDPLVMPALEIKVIGGGDDTERVLNLAPVVGREGHYEGRFVPQGEGAFRLSLELPSRLGEMASEKETLIEKDILVSKPDLEMKDTALNRAALRAFVDAADPASTYIEVDSTDTIPSRILDQSRTRTHTGRIRPLWDNRYVFGLLIVLLTVEWILRKVAKLL